MIFHSLYLLLSPFLWIPLRIASFFFAKGRRRTFTELPAFVRALRICAVWRRKRPAVVFHAASGGELEQLIPVLEQIDRSQICVILTIYSPTIYDTARRSSLCDALVYLPLDSALNGLAFFALFRPAFFVVTRHDIWPAHLWAARRLGVGTLFMNANLYASSKRFRPGLRGFTAACFASFDRIFTGSERMKKLLSQVADSEKITLCGDTRFDRVVQRREKACRRTKPLIVDAPPRSQTFVLGSIVPSDYALLFSALKQCREEGVPLSIIAVPHEVDSKTIADLCGYLEDVGFSVGLYSDTPAFQSRDVLVVNTTGILADLYAYGGRAYVGAGFSTGVHSVIEPAVYDTCVAFGPNIDLLDEAVRMKEAGLAAVIHSAADVRAWVRCKEADRTKMHAAQRKFIHQNTGAADYISNYIRQSL
ncbi:MAG: 3-deoxy-D-manno-octulosonic acid transferase [Fibrobacterota bacterium]